jgi:hypothetical protein
MNAMNIETNTVVSHLNIDAAPDRVWRSLVFYEGLDTAPPLYLRLLLPSPIRTEGAKSIVGDAAKCLYQGGHLLKRVTRIDVDRLYEFTVEEQHLPIGGGIRLSGGCYALRYLGRNRTELAITTGYVSRHRPRWLVQRVESAVCHLFHRHLLTAIKTKAEFTAEPVTAL